MIALFIPGVLNAQTVSIKWGKPFNGKVFKGSFRLLSLNEQGLAVLSPVPAFMGIINSVSVVKFDGALNYLSVTKFPLKYNDQTLEYEFIVRMKGHILVFSSYNDNKAEKKFLYYNEFDQDSQTMASQTVQVLEMPLIKKPFPVSGSFSYVLSADSANIAVIYNPPSTVSGQEKFGCAVIDKDLNVIYTRMQEFPFKDRNFNFENAAVSKKGILYLSGQLTTGLKNPMKKEPNYKYAILRIDPAEEIPREIYTDLDKLFITDMQIGCNYSDDLIAAGFYSEEGKFSIKGCFSIKLDGGSGDVFYSSTKEFPLELITAGMTEKQVDKTEEKADKGKNVEMENYSLDDLVIRPDEGVYLVAEQNYSITRTYTNSNGSTSTTTTYYANSIIVVGINSNGEIDATQKILKAQKASSPSIIGYILAASGQELVFIFTDNALNNAPHPQKTQWANFGKSGITTIAILNAQGEVARTNLYSFDKNPFFIYPYMSYPLNDGRIILVGRGGMKAKLALVTVN